MLLNKTSGKTFGSESILLIFAETFPLYGTIGEEKIPEEDYAYLNQPLVMLASFLNLPNRKRLSPKFTFSDLLKNMIDRDVEDERNRKFSTLDKVLAAPMFIYHVLRSLITLPFSLLKIATEFAPALGEEACRIAMENNKGKNKFKYYAAKIGYGLFNGLHFVGRAFTSPVKGWLISDHKKTSLGFASLITSGFIWGMVGALLMAGPVIAIAATAEVAINLITTAVGLTPISIIGILVQSLIKIHSEEGLVKPFIKHLINKIRPAKKNTSPEIEGSYNQMFTKTPPIPTQDSTNLNKKEYPSSHLTSEPSKSEPSKSEPSKSNTSTQAVDFRNQTWVVQRPRGG